MLNPTCTVFTCMLLFTKHNYKAKKLNYLTLKLSTQREQHIPTRMYFKLRIHESLKCRHSCLEVVYRVNVGVCTAHRSVSLEATFNVATLLSQCNRPWCEQCSFNVSRHDLAVPASWKFIPTHTTYTVRS
jgi:hypothetical protein